MRRAQNVALSGGVLLLVAFTFDAAPLFVPAIAFIALGLAAPAWVWLSTRHTSIERHLESDRVIEQDPLEATIEVRRGSIGLPGAEVIDPLARAPVSVTQPLSLIRGGRHAEVRIITHFARRGLRELAPPSLVVRDPLSLATLVCRSASPAQEVLVLPATEPVRWRWRRGELRAEQASGRTMSEPIGATDVDGLRPYRPGAPASRIHWQALARGAGLLERRLQADGDSRPLVALDARGSGPIEQLDAAVRAAASLTIELARLGGCRVVLPGERRAVVVEPDLAAWPSIHARLALVEGGPRTRAPLIEVGGRVGPVFYVAAQPLERLPAALSSAHGAVVVVLPKAVGGARPGRPCFEVAACEGFIVAARSIPDGPRRTSRARVAAR